jgi:hypothetical protein
MSCPARGPNLTIGGSHRNLKVSTEVTKAHLNQSVMRSIPHELERSCASLEEGRQPITFACVREEGPER